MKKNKTFKIASIIFTALATGMVILSGIMKLSGSEEVVTKLTSVGVGKYIPLLGLMEIAFAVLFLIPKTRKIGFILLTCYFSGAIATDLSHGMTIVNASMVLGLVWIAALLLDHTIFLPSAPKASLQQ